MGLPCHARNPLARTAPYVRDGPHPCPLQGGGPAARTCGRAGRQVDLASRAHAGGDRRGHEPDRRTAGGGGRARHGGGGSGHGGRDRTRPRWPVDRERHRARWPAPARSAARHGQFGNLDPAVDGIGRGAAADRVLHGRRLAVAPADGARHRTADRHGRRGDGEPGRAPAVDGCAARRRGGRSITACRSRRRR